MTGWGEIPDYADPCRARPGLCAGRAPLGRPPVARVAGLACRALLAGVWWPVARVWAAVGR